MAYSSRSANAYASGASQNTGNVMTGRSTTRRLAPPGGASSISFGWAEPPAQAAHTAPKVTPAAQPTSAPAVIAKPTAPVAAYTPAGTAPPAKENKDPIVSAAYRRGVSQNAFANGASQNTGNFISDRPSSRVLSAPGGRSSIVLG